MSDLIIDLLENKIEHYSNKAIERYKYYQYCMYSDVRKELIYILKNRSKYKRALKEYKELLHKAQMDKYKNAIKEYREHPNKYIEEMLGLKLYPHQKLMLKCFNWRKL